MFYDPDSCMLLHALASACSQSKQVGPLCCMYLRPNVCFNMQSSFMAAWLHLSARCRHPAK